jgi:hypothetical protein
MNGLLGFVGALGLLWLGGIGHASSETAPASRSLGPAAIVDDGRAESDLPDQLPGVHLPTLQEHHYTMSGRVRPLLAFWIGRDDVGSGWIRWKRSEHTTAYELMIGSDPDLAPGRLNRWGYLVEEVRGGESLVFGLMSKSDEQSLNEAEAGLTKAGQARPFETMRGHVAERSAYALISPIRPPRDLTYRDAGTAINLFFATPPNGEIREVTRPVGGRAGFLTSVAELVHATASAHRPGARTSSPALSYVYGYRVYELRIREVVALSRFEAGGRVYDNVLLSRFEAQREGSRQTSRFELVYPTRGPLAEVPIRISYRPKWWLEVELHLTT